MYQDVFFTSVFFAGILSFFSPCIIPLLPVYMGNLLGNLEDEVGHKKRFSIQVNAILKTLFFILGISFVFFLLGFGAGALGTVLYHPYTNYVLGSIVILLGLHQMEILKIPILYRQKTIQIHHKHTGYIGAFLLGLTFSFGWTPCIGPVLSSVLAIAASQTDSAFYGGILMIVYALGLAVPFLILALTSSFLMNRMNFIKKHMLIMKRIGGLLIIMMGILLMFDKLNYFITFI